MHAPRLRAWLQDDRAAARLLESAIRHEQRVVPLVAPPTQGGPHVLEVPLRNGQIVCVIAEPVGLGRPDGVPLDLRPTDAVQMPELFAMVEQLDRPEGPSVARVRAAGPAPAAPPVVAVPQSTPKAPIQATARAASVPSSREPPPRVRPKSQPPLAARAPAPVPPPPASRTELMARPASPRAPVERPAPLPPQRSTAPSLPSLDFFDLPDAGSEDTHGSEDLEVDVEIDLGPDGEVDDPHDDAPTLFHQPAPRGRPTEPRDPGAPEPRRPSYAPNLTLAIPGQGGPVERPLTLGKGGASQATSAPVRSQPEAPTASTALGELLGKTIAGKYAIEKSLGRGISGEVYRAQHTSLNRAVAVKVLHRENQDNEQFVKRFKAEGRTLSKLEHHNIARVIDFGEEPSGLLYLVMELLAGKSLEDLLRSGEKLSIQQVLDIGIQTSSGLAFAHDEGVIHRDVKPDNIVLVPHRDDDGKPCSVVKVCDFGLAKLRAPTGTEQDNRENDLTIAGAMCGSPSYMSPEQLLGEPLDARTDIYALGVTLYESLSGAFPHEGEGLTGLFVKKLTTDPLPLRGRAPEVSAALEAVIMRAISRDKANRQNDARAFRQELRDVLASLR